MKTIIHDIFAAVLLAAGIPATAAAGNPVQEYIEAAADGTVLGNAGFGMLAVTSGGDTLAAYDFKRAMVPASNMKLITTGAALHRLGADYRYKTGIGYSGTVKDGILHGDLYIIGGGDPTIASRDSIAVPVEQTFRQWRQFIADAGIKRIEGHIVGDDRFFDRVMEEDSWLWNDLGTYYGTGVSGLSFYENVQDFNVAPGAVPGEAVKVSPGYPEAPWMEYRYSCTTGAPGTGNKLYYYTSSLAPVGEMRGTFASDRAPKTEEGSNKFPAYTCAWHFMEYLRGCGVECSEGAADLGDTFGQPKGMVCPADSITIIGSTVSPALKRIAFETNYESNNFFAETIFKTLGREYSGKGSYETGRQAVKSILYDLGVKCSGVKIQDGSGLSRQNYISPEFFCTFLNAMLGSPAASDYLMTMPSPGSNGTMSYLMSRYASETRSRILIKSGSMDGVLCYSGYILPPGVTSAEVLSCMTGQNPAFGTDASLGRNDIIIFSIMTNNCTSSPYRVRQILEKILYLLTTGVPSAGVNAGQER